MDYVNEHASPGAIIHAWGPNDVANAFARDDLSVYSSKSGTNPEFVLACDDALQRRFFAEWETVFTVEKESVVLSLVKSNPDR